MNILLSAVGRRAYLVDYFKAVVHPLGGRVFATNTTADATGFLVADETSLVPPSSSDEYINTMIGLCKTWKIKLLFSLHDWDAPVIARHRQAFLDIGTLPVMADAKVLACCLDKWETYQAMLQLGVNVPKTYLSLEEVDAALKHETTFPLIVKPRWGQGSIGLFKVYDREELHLAYQLSERAAIRFASVCPEIDASQPQVLIQECVLGEEYGCDIVNNLEGDFQRAFVKHKFGMRSGETDIAESVSLPAIESLAQKIAQWSRHLGCMDSDFIIDKGGRPYLIELNPRFGGGYPFTHSAGANIPQALVAWAQGRDIQDEWYRDYKLHIRTYKEIALLII